MEAFSFPPLVPTTRHASNTKEDKLQMKHPVILSLAIAASALTQPAKAQIDIYADEVIAYQPGIGFAIDFSTGQGLTNTTRALGEPARITTGDFGGPIDPFSPPFSGEELLSIGEGGFIVLAFDPPIFNHPSNPFGLDLILYGNTGFSITNGNFSGGGITDGSTFGHNEGTTRIGVSNNNQDYHWLDHDQARTADHLYPTDGEGRFGHPVDPGIQPVQFAGNDLGQIRDQYSGSAGGTGYDLDWATDEEGNPVELDSIRYLRIEVLKGKTEIDGVCAVLPAPFQDPGEISESFATDPRHRGWQTTGEPLFTWDPSRQGMRVHWDSSQPNSYFHRSLGRTIGTDQSFSLAFDLELETIEIGTTPMKSSTFPIAIGLIDLNQATRADHYRGSGIHAVHGPRGVAEWNYFPDSGYGATVSSGLISQDNQWAYQNTFPLELSTGVRYHVNLHYDANSATLKTEMTADEEPFGPLQEVQLNRTPFTRLDVDTLAISSYSDAGQSPPEFAGSISAKGFLDHLEFRILSQPLIDRLTLNGGTVQIHFEALQGHAYWLETSHDLTTWIPIAHQVMTGTGPAHFTHRQEDDVRFFRLSQAP